MVLQYHSTAAPFDIPHQTDYRYGNNCGVVSGVSEWNSQRAFQRETLKLDRRLPASYQIVLQETTEMRTRSDERLCDITCQYVDSEYVYRNKC